MIISLLQVAAGDLGPGGKPYADSLVNNLGDTLFEVLGWFSAMKIIGLSNQ